MDTPQQRDPLKIMRSLIALCADCDTCRTMLEEECVFFPQLYRLWDEERATGVPAGAEQMRALVNLCTFCGLCPCPRIPADIMLAKSLFVEKEGLPRATRLLIDVPGTARLCGTFPSLYNAFARSRAGSSLIRAAAGVHRDRALPGMPRESFFRWARRRGLTGKREGEVGVSYFAGCTAGYLFPEVGRATVKVLERNGVTVHVPAQGCCGMPYLLEGDLEGTLACGRQNVENLLPEVQRGADIVCSCSSCAFFFKALFRERAYYADAYQAQVGAGENELKVPERQGGEVRFRVLRKSTYGQVLKDDGYFSGIDPLARIAIAEHLFDAGEYLAALHGKGALDCTFSPLPQRLVYFAPCHQREQKMQRPYLHLLRLIPGVVVEPVGAVDCCGMGGNYGYKEEFYEHSLSIGRPLMEKIRKAAPDAIVTDCLSCRLQFSHLLPYPVYHPMEILERAYGLDEG